MGEYHVTLRKLFDKQVAFKRSKAKRKVGRIGRRGGKTTLAADISVEKFLEGHRVLYAVPTADQLDRWWAEVENALAEPVEAGIFYRNETRHLIELKGTEQRIRGKTAWNANTLRGDFCDLLVLDEFQHMDEDALELVGLPMLLDNNGDLILYYTPPSLHSRSVSKAKDPQHAAKLFKRARELRAAGDKRWETFHWTSKDNPRISKEALAEIAKDMTSLAYRMEILAEDVDEAPGALWAREQIEAGRVVQAPDLARIVVGVDPSATRGGDEAGIVTAGRGKGKRLYVLSDDTLQGSPMAWAQAAVTAYHKFKADCIVAEKNNGGEMVELTIHSVKGAENIPVVLVSASRGKQTRAEPISAIYEQGRGHHVGSFPALEDEQCLWQPNSGAKSPNRLDALVWAASKLMLNDAGPLPKAQPEQESKWRPEPWSPMKKY
ncbi:MAG TPA: hypothetical protein VJP78_02180 [Thermoleophilia bacterium]|nr:hypothetical protein [Thermoleophilia bacterium]